MFPGVLFGYFKALFHERRKKIDEKKLHISYLSSMRFRDIQLREQLPM